MSTSDKKILFWRGTREAFNSLSEWNPWTHYAVKEVNGTWSTFYGIQKISSPGGQLEPVKSVIDDITNLPSHKQGDRYLIGSDEKGYWVVEIGPSESAEGGFSVNMIPLGTYSVRILDRMGKEYQYVDKHLVSYDDFDGGEF